MRHDKAAIPAGWPQNELMGEDVIIPPAADEQTAKEGSQQDEEIGHEDAFENML